MTERDPGKSSRRRILGLLKKAAAVIAVAALVGWVVWGAWQDAREVEWPGLQVRPGLVAASMVMLAGAMFVHGLVWVLMMRGLGYRLGWVAGMRAAVLSQLGNYIPGKVFIMVVRAQVARQHGLPGLPVASSVVLETVLRNLVAGGIIAVGLLELGLEPGIGERLSGQGLGGAYGGALVAFLVVSAIAAHPWVFERLVSFLLLRLGRDPLPRGLSGLSTILLLAGYFLYWALYVGGFRLLAFGTMGAQVTGGWGLTISVLLAQIGSTLAVFTPVGLGVADATLAGVLTLTGAASAPYVLSVVTRVWRTVTELMAIGIAWLLGRGAGGQEPPPEKA